MTSGRMLRPALVCLLALSGAGCGMVEADPHRFETLAQGIASIPIDGHQTASRPSAGVAERPAVRVEVLDPHDFWDARDGRLQQGVKQTAPVVAEAAAPAAARAVLDHVEARLADVAVSQSRVLPVPSGENARRLIQLGAYSSESAARAAWLGFARSDAHGVLSDLQPRFEQADVNGRPVVRLKVSAPSRRVGAVCQTTGIDAPWCVAGA